MSECILNPNSCGTDPASISTFTAYCTSDNKLYNSCGSTGGIIPSVVIGSCYHCQSATTTTGSVGKGSSTIQTTASTLATLVPTASPASTLISGSTTTTIPTADTSTGAGVGASTTSGTTTKATNVAVNGVTKGAAAGIAIGCLLVGALLAALVAFFLFRRKRQQNAYPQHHLPHADLTYMGHEKNGMTGTTLGSGAGAVVTNVDRLLPQPAEDDAIIGGLSKIRDGIKNHVQNYYHNSPVSHEAVNEAALAELANATGIPTSSLKTLLLTPGTRTYTIMTFLSQLALSRCTGRIDGQVSFLPAEISRVVSPLVDASSSQLALFSKWKTISGALLQQQYGQQPDENDPRKASIAQALAAAEPILYPFIDPSVDAAARLRNLESILKRAAQFAFLLFSQPGCFQFDFIGTGQAESLLVFPAMIQTVSDEAERLSPPRVLSAKEIMTGLGM